MYDICVHCIGQQPKQSVCPYIKAINMISSYIYFTNHALAVVMSGSLCVCMSEHYWIHYNYCMLHIDKKQHTMYITGLQLYIK
jgi:hypothetical protein